MLRLPKPRAYSLSAIAMLVAASACSTTGPATTAGLKDDGGGTTIQDKGGAAGTAHAGGTGGRNAVARGGSGGASGAEASAGQPSTANGGMGGSGGTESGGPSGGAPSCPPAYPMCMSPAPPTTEQCDPNAVWGTPHKLNELSANGNAQLAGLTPDENVVLWYAGQPPVLSVATRPSPLDTFGTALHVSIPSGYGADGFITLTPNGLHLLLTRNDHTALAQLSRSSVDEPFSAAADETPFVNVPHVSTSGNPAPVLVRAPVMSASGRLLFFVSDAPNEPGQLYVSTYYDTTQSSGAYWDAGARLKGAELISGTAGMAQIPLGTSIDERTLFVFDESTQRAKEVSRVTSAANPTSLADWRDVHPSGDCQRLYFSSPAGGIFVTQAQ